MTMGSLSARTVCAVAVLSLTASCTVTPPETSPAQAEGARAAADAAGKSVTAPTPIQVL